MATEGIYWFDDAGNNITLEFSTDLTSSPLVYTAVPELKDIGRNPAASDQIPFTHYGSTRKERKTGLPDDGTWDATSNFLPKHATTALLVALGESKATRYWRITYPKSDTASSVQCTEVFTASIETISIDPPGSEETTPTNLNLTLLGAGEYTFTPES